MSCLNKNPHASMQIYSQCIRNKLVESSGNSVSSYLGRGAPWKLWGATAANGSSTGREEPGAAEGNTVHVSSTRLQLPREAGGEFVIRFWAPLLCFLLGEAEGKDERRTQQTPLGHGGQASVRVQRETAAPPQREDGGAGGEGNEETD